MTQEPKITPTELRRQAEAMVAAGTMPSLETVLEAVAEVRQKYRPEIREAQRQAKIHFAKQREGSNRPGNRQEE